MKVININQAKINSELNKLIEAYAEHIKNEKPSDGFKAISIFSGWETEVNKWVLLRLDYEANKNKDLLLITDIKYKLLNRLSINYVSCLGLDYDEFIESIYSQN